MNFYADYVRNKLNAAISSMSSQIEDYVKNPGHDFTRNRKMNFTSTINFLLTMEGGSLNSELHKYFNYDLILSILVDTFISKISLPMQPVPEIRSISGA